MNDPAAQVTLHQVETPRGQDAGAIDYFSEHCPEYSTRRLRFTIRRLRKLVPADASIADVGCGTGNVLRHLREKGGFTNLTGFDPSAEMAALAHVNSGCRVSVLSVLDDEAIAARAGQFDVVILAAVLHHLVGPTRRESRRLAARGLRNALRLVRPRGYLVVIEPTFEPRMAMSVVFHLKRLVTRFTGDRIELGGKWNNIGAPVVSFLTHADLMDMTAGLERARIKQVNRRERNLSLSMRLGGIRERTDTTIILRRRPRRSR